MHCPFCPHEETQVLDSRVSEDGRAVRRRRRCEKCDKRFTTYERVEEVMPAVIKKDDRREAFLRAKIFDGIQKACQKRPVTTLQLEDAVLRIEKKIQSYGLKEIPSRTIGQMVMLELHQLDKVAYVRFASVYRDFQDVEEFVAELTHQEPPRSDEDPSLLLFPFALGHPPEGQKNS